MFWCSKQLQKVTLAAPLPSPNRGKPHTLQMALRSPFFVSKVKKMTVSPGQTRPLMWINKTSSWEKICKLIFFQLLVGIWLHWVSRGHYLLVLGGNGSVLGGTWLVLDCTWSVEGSNGCYLVVMDQYRVVLVGTWWYWIKTVRYWLPAWYAFRKCMIRMV